MKIKNDLISIKIGKKRYDFTNLILDEYLKRFVNSQLDETKTRNMSNIKDLECCLIKFDTPFTNIQNNSEIHNQEFDICLVGNLEYTEELGKKQITVRYKYSSNFIWDYEKATAQNITISNYYGKKITAIGFNVWWGSDENFETKLPICAILDVSNYNIYLQKNQNLEVVRKDIITTDAEFWSNSDKVKSPAHLTPKGIPAVLKQEDIVNEDGSVSKFNINAFGILYSIGLSSYTDYIDKEFVIGRDVQLEQNNTEIIIKGIENYLSTDNPLFLDSNKLFTNSDLYPIKSNYKYILFKYKVWQEVVTRVDGQDVYTPTDTGTYYYQAIPIDKFGKNDFKIKYERS
jgi:hypothetical protein